MFGVARFLSWRREGAKEQTIDDTFVISPGRVPAGASYMEYLTRPVGTLFSLKTICLG